MEETIIRNQVVNWRHLIMANNQPIGFFDSGVGGISVLQAAVALLPQEDFIYYGDSANAPYGDKTVEEIQGLTARAVDFLLAKGCKAIVVACNTATSAAIDLIRETYPQIPIIGIEPALKVAMDHTSQGKVLVLATLRTLQEKKFQDLSDRYAQTRTVIRRPLPGLVEIIEKGGDFQEKSFQFLQRALADVDKDVSAVVLGCTHYPFIKPSLRRLFPGDTLIVDGSEGTSRHLRDVLAEKDLLAELGHPGSVTLYNSSPDPAMIDLSRALLREEAR